MRLTVDKYFFTVFIQLYPSNSLALLFTRWITVCEDEANQFPFLRPRAADAENQCYFISWHRALGIPGVSTALQHPPFPRNSVYRVCTLHAAHSHPAARISPSWPQSIGVCNTQVTSTFSCHLNECLSLQPWCFVPTRKPWDSCAGGS